jgi:hypothetical protein
MVAINLEGLIVRRLITFLLGLVVVLAFVVGVVAIGWLVVSWFFALPDGAKTPVAGFTGVLLVPVITYFTTRSLQRRSARESAMRDQKNRFYDEFIRGFMDYLNSKVNDQKKEVKIQKLFADTAPRLLTYGSRGVILAWNKFRFTAASEPNESLFRFEDLLKEMRKDLGHSTFTTQKGDLLGVWINDIGAHMSKQKNELAAARLQKRRPTAKIASDSDNDAKNVDNKS